MTNLELVSHTGQVQKFGRHSNAFGFLRLFFASAVIISHVPEIFYGNRNKEILTRLFGSISLGDLAVDVFFLISGYLITASFMVAKRHLITCKRELLENPSFLCAYFICGLIVAPVGDAKMPNQPAQFISIIVRALLLQPPNVGDTFPDTPFPFLNSSMWTINIELKCYLLVLLIGSLVLFNKNI